MNKLIALAPVLLLAFHVSAAAAGQIEASDINDFVVMIAEDVAGFLHEAGAEEVAVFPFKKADDDGEYALSEVLTGQILQELRYNREGYSVLGPSENTAAFRVTGLWRVEGDTVKVTTRIVKMPTAEVDITYSGTIPVRRVPAVYLAAGAGRKGEKKEDSGVRIAVMDFRGYEKYPPMDYLGRSIPETITTIFAQQSDLVLVERLQRDKIMSELTLAESEYINPDAVVEVGKLLGANYMIIGSYQKRGDRVRLRARRVKVETGEIFEAASVVGKEKELFELEDRLANTLLDDIQKYR